ncbi:MAG: phage tail tube protein [Thermodesulfobacteriota bacterium]|nr:phage tail tube protein [Thermodesulfobacteriota bacterium]
MTIGQGGVPAALSYFAVFQEDAFGTVTGLTAGTNGTAFEPLSFGIKTEIESQKLDTISRNRGTAKRVQLNKTVAGAVETFLHPFESSRFLFNVMGGTVTSAGGSTNVYIHSITAGNFSHTALASLAIKSRVGSSHYRKYIGGRVNQLTISGNIGEPIKMSAEMIFGDMTMTSSDSIDGTLSLSTKLPFTFDQANFIYAATTASLTTTNKEFIESFEFTINNNLDESRALGTNGVVCLPPKRREVGLKFTQRFDTTTAYDRFVAQTASAVEIRIEGASLSSSQNDQLSIILPKVYFNSPDPTVDGGSEILRMEIECDVVCDNPMTTTGKDVGMTLYNGTASY